jgi:hypothetical protein
MKYRCGHCDEDHDICDLTINIGDEGHKLIDDIDTVVMDIVVYFAEGASTTKAGQHQFEQSIRIFRIINFTCKPDTK